MNIICFSNIDWSFIKQRQQQLMTEISHDGDIEKVIFIETFGTRDIKLNKEDIKRGFKKLFRVKSKGKSGSVIPEKISVIHPVYLPFLNKPCLYINKILFKASFKRLLKRENISLKDTAAWVYLSHPVVDYIVNSFKFKTVVFDCIDDLKSFKDVKPIILETEEKLICKANLVFATSKLLLERCLRLNSNSRMLKNAVNGDFLKSTDTERKKNKNIKIGYIGAIYDWFDANCIRMLSDKFHNVEIELAGPIRIDLEDLKSRQNVKLLGTIPYESVEGLIESFDVCLIPFIKSELILNTNPVKLYEYFSKGKPVVAIDIPELSEFRDIAYLYNDKQEFLECVSKAINEDSSEKRQKRIDAARQNTWEMRAAEALNFIKTGENS